MSEPWEETLARVDERRAERDTAITGVGLDVPTITNDVGAKQSSIPYRCDLMPGKAALVVAGILRDGSAKYGDNNWRGIPLGDHINHALMHIYAHLAGDNQDDHLGHAACRMLMAVEMAANGR